MEHSENDEDRRLERMLRAVRAEADPAVWTRARARIAGRRPAPALLRWAMRPAALAVSFAMLLGAATLALVLASGSAYTGGEEYATLGEALLAEREAEAAQALPADGAARDSGQGR